MGWGRLYGIGVGPGDPELLTLKARRILEEIDLLFVPKSRMEKRSVALSIVSQAVPKQWQCIDLLMPMTSDQSQLEQHWEESAIQVVDMLGSGRDGAFITLGDPTLFSTFTYLLKHIMNREPEVQVEIIPGISAVNSVAAYLQQPLAEGDENLVIVPALQGQEALEDIINRFDNIVLMKAGRQVKKICAVLEEHGSGKQAQLVSRCGFSDAFVSHDLRSLQGEELDYLSTVIIKNIPGGGSQ